MEAATINTHFCWRYYLMVCLWCLAVNTFPSPNDFLLFLHCSSSPQETRHFPYPNIFLIFFLRSSSHEVTRYFPYPNIFVLSPSLFFFSSGGQIFLFSKYSPLSFSVLLLLHWPNIFLFFLLLGESRVWPGLPLIFTYHMLVLFWWLNLHTLCDNLIRWRGQVANSSPILSVSFQRLGSRPCTHSSFAPSLEKIQIWMHTAPKAGQNDSDPTETQMGGSARGGDLGREWIAPPTATGTRSSVWVCVSLLSAAVEREQLGAERLVVTKYSIVVTKYIPVTIVSMAGR